MGPHVLAKTFDSLHLGGREQGDGPGSGDIAIGKSQQKPHKLDFTAGKSFAVELILVAQQLPQATKRIVQRCIVAKHGGKPRVPRDFSQRNSCIVQQTERRVALQLGVEPKLYAAINSQGVAELFRPRIGAAYATVASFHHGEALSAGNNLATSLEA